MQKFQVVETTFATKIQLDNVQSQVDSIQRTLTNTQDAFSSRLSTLEYVYSFTKNLTVGTDWMDTGIRSGDLPDGTYVVAFWGWNSGNAGQYSETYTGLMRWYSGGTNSEVADEIPLHRCGHAPNSGVFYLRTLRHPGNIINVTLQVRCNQQAANVDVQFRFKKIL